MHVDHHPLIQDFPELRAELQRLRQEDSHFARQAEAYEALDKRIYEVEDGRLAMDDLALQALKNERVALKDQIAERLRKAGG